MMGCLFLPLNTAPHTGKKPPTKSHAMSTPQNHILYTTQPTTRLHLSYMLSYHTRKSQIPTTTTTTTTTTTPFSFFWVLLLKYMSFVGTTTPEMTHTTGHRPRTLTSRTTQSSPVGAVGVVMLPRLSSY